MTPHPTAPTARARRRPSAARPAILWAFLIAATLVFKSFVPMLAAASAGLQGKPVADICPVYGVRLAAAVAAVPAPMDIHVGHDMASMPVTTTHAHGDVAAVHPHPRPADPAPDHDHAGHARDHCALGGLAACAVLAAVLLGLPAAAPAAVPPPAARAVVPVADASARWLALRLHAPPLRG